MKLTRSRGARLGILALACAALAGCHGGSPFHTDAMDHFEITIRNQGAPVRQVEVDYPSASFGQDYLGSGATYRYRPKLIGSGPVKVTFTDGSGKSHTATGPAVKDGERANFIIVIGQDESVAFQVEPAKSS
jgi:hypothetical protein